MSHFAVFVPLFPDQLSLCIFCLMSVLKRDVCVHDVWVRKTERRVCVCDGGEVLVCMRLRVICVCVCVCVMGGGACVYESDMCVCV